MRCGLWSRRLSRWRTRKSLPTDQAALRAASVTARDVSPGFRPGKCAVAARAARVVAAGVAVRPPAATAATPLIAAAAAKGRATLQPR
jgi:hypothetical protein